MKITLNREHKAVMLQALSDGFIYEMDLNTIKGVETFIPDRPMSRKDYGRLLLKLKCQEGGEDESDDSAD